MYAAGQQHSLRAPSREVLNAVEAARLDAVISAEVVQEVFHRFLAIRRPDLAQVVGNAALDLFAPVLPITHDTVLRLPALAVEYPSLPSRDLVHVATCLENDIDVIVSADRHFDQVRQLRRVAPGDRDALARLLR